MLEQQLHAAFPPERNSPAERAEALTAFASSGRGDMLAEAYRLQGTLLLRQTVPDVVVKFATIHG